MTDKNWWINMEERHYRCMHGRHRRLWSLVEKFIKDNQIKSAIEVGGGLHSKVKPLVADYKNVDINESIPETIHEDFTTMDVSKLGSCDLLIACAVIEHCKNGYKDFLSQIAKIKPKMAFVTFFNGLKRDKEEFHMRCAKRKDRGGGYPWNLYTFAGVKEHLKSIGLLERSEFIELNDKDVILIIR